MPKKSRTVTTDNFFIGLALVQKLCKINTTIVGTVNKIRKEIPEKIKNRRVPWSKPSFWAVKKLSVHSPLIKRKLIKPSSYWSNGKKEEAGNYLTLQWQRYGVVLVDQMAGKCSVKATSRRRPVQIFYNILDLAAINAISLYKQITRKNIKRRDFISSLAEEMAFKYSQNRKATMESRKYPAKT